MNKWPIPRRRLFASKHQCVHSLKGYRGHELALSPVASRSSVARTSVRPMVNVTRSETEQCCVVACSWSCEPRWLKKCLWLLGTEVTLKNFHQKNVKKFTRHGLPGQPYNCAENLNVFLFSRLCIFTKGRLMEPHPTPWTRYQCRNFATYYPFILPMSVPRVARPRKSSSISPFRDFYDACRSVTS